jgi:hypothetical protein
MSGDEENDEVLIGYVLARRDDRLEQLLEQDIKKLSAGRKSTCISERNAQGGYFSWPICFKQWCSGWPERELSPARVELIGI